MPTASLFCDHCGAANRAQAAFCFACGQPLYGTPAASSADTLPAGSELHGRYRILGQLGKGGFGEVYRAADLQLGERLVAIKEMSQAGLNAREMQEASEAFKNEALILAQLRHPNLPSIHEYFSEAGRWYLVMDFLEGQTLADYLERTPEGRLTPAEVITIAIQLCTVLDYLHTRRPPVIFRDLKPSNVMRSPDGQLYLIDFGIARHFKPGQAKDTVAFGSAGYAAPEQYGKAQTTARADIYSLGATLHELLTGKDPSEKPFEFDPPQDLVPTVHPAFGEFIMRMLAMNASQRPASAAEVLQELQRYSSYWSANFVPTRPRLPVMPTQSLPSFTPPQPQFYFVPSSLTSSQPQPYFASTQPPPYAQYRAASAPVAFPTVGPGLSRLQFPFVYTGHGAAVYAVGWAPDSMRIASAGRDHQVRVWSIQNGDTLNMYRDHSAAVRALAWAGDGMRIASGGEDCTVHIWDAARQGALVVYRWHQHHVNALSWSLDGIKIASASSDRTVHIWDTLNSQKIYVFTEHIDAVCAVAWSPDGQFVASGGEDRTVHIWHFYTSQCVMTYTGHRMAVRALAWSPNSKYIVSAGKGGEVHIWEAASGRPRVQHYQGGNVLALARSPRGDRVVSGGAMKGVEVWDAIANVPLFTYEGHPWAVYALAWSPDGKYIASAGEDGSVQVWQAP